MSITREEALSKLAGHRAALEKLGVAKIGLFGSVVRNEARPDSDIDLLVEFAKPPSLFALCDVQNYLEGVFSCKVDLATSGMLGGAIRARVMAEVVYE